MRFELVENVHQRQGHQQHRRRLAELLAADPVLRALPRVRSLSFTVMREDGRVASLSDLLRDGQRMLLCGAAGSGRRLALVQYLDQWIVSNDNRRTPLPIDLFTLDNGTASPHALLTALIASLAQPDTTWLLICSGWEELPPARREAWRTTLIHGPLPQGCDVGVVVAPADEALWPGFSTLLAPKADEQLAAAWLVELAPTAPQHVLLAAAGPIVSLSSCVFAVWLYEQGRLRALRSEREQLLQTVAQPFVARSAEQLAIGLGCDRWYQHRATLLADAHQIMQQEAYAQVSIHPLRADLAALLVEIAPPGDSLLTALWQASHSDAELLLIAGYVLLERPADSPALTLLVLRALAWLARTADRFNNQAHAILMQSNAILETALAAAADKQAFRIVRSILFKLPQSIALPHLAHYAYHDTIPEQIGWELTDRLISYGQIEGLQPYAAVALSRWAYAHSLDPDTGHEQIVLNGPADALRALAELPITRRTRAAGILLHNVALPAVVRLGALTILDQQPSRSSIEHVEPLINDPVHEIRLAAIESLKRHDLRYALAVVATTARTQLPDAIRHDAIMALLGFSGRAVVTALYDCAVDVSLGLALRLQSLCGLAGRFGGLKRLHLVAIDQNAHAGLRAMALNLLGLRPVAARHRSTRSALPAALVANAETPILVAIAACEQLGTIGGTRAIQSLVRLVEDTTDDPALLNAVIAALGRIGDPQAVTALAPLLGIEALLRLQHACPAEVRRQPTAEALSMLPEALARSIQMAVDSCLTAADRPTTPKEYLVIAADTLRRSTAKALTQIGGIEAQTALQAALIQGECGTALPSLVDALADIPSDQQPTGLAELLHHPELSMRVRWVVAQRLAATPSALREMLAGVSDVTLDGFTRGALAEGLGNEKSTAAALALAELIRDQSTDPYLRERAVAGLGTIGGAASEVVLRRLATDPQEAAQIRAVAASHLGVLSTDETRRLLYSLLDEPNVASAIVIGVLQALSEQRDARSFACFLRYTRDPRSDVARAAITALAAHGDANATTELLALSQNADADRMVRLHAVGALLKIADRDYSLLMRDYLNNPSLPIQMQALEQTIAAHTEPAYLLLFLQDAERAMPFRVRILEALVGRIGSAVPLAAILHTAEELPELRGRIAQLMATIGGPTAHNLLAEVALRVNDHPGVRLACIEALLARKDASAATVFTTIAEAPDEQPTIRTRATAALVQILTPAGGTI